MSLELGVMYMTNTFGMFNYYLTTLKGDTIMGRFNHSNFSIQGGQGFQITFENGYTVSVQFGQYHYCSNKNLKRNDDVYTKDCRNAETAIFYKDTHPFHKHKGDDVQSYQSPKEVLETLKYAESLPNPEEEAYDIWEGAEDTDELDKKVSGIKRGDIDMKNY